MKGAVTIRHANAADNVAISAVHQASIRGLCSAHYPPEPIEAWASRRTPEFYERVLEVQELFVAERDGRVVAFGQLDLESGMIISVYVAPEAARTGVGRAMMSYLEDTLQLHGWAKIHLTASLNAVPFFEKLGYEQVSPFTHQVATDVTLDCVDMRKVLARD